MFSVALFCPDATSNRSAVSDPVIAATAFARV